MVKQMSIILALLLIGVLTVAAEDVNCGDLSEADCQVLSDNHARMHELSAFHFEAEMGMEVQGVASQDILKLELSGSGDLAMDAAAADGIDDMAEQAEAIIGSLAGQMSFVLSLVEEGKTETIELDMLMRDSIFLFSGSIMDELMGAPMDDMDWFGLDLTGAIDAVLEQTGISEEALQDSPEPAETMGTITRLDDSVVNGVPVAVFESLADLDALMAGGAESIDEFMAPLGMAGTMISSGEMTSRHYVGLDDGYTYRQEMSGDFRVKGLTIEGASGDLDATMSLSIDLSAFNVPVEVELPEDVPAFPLAMMLAMGNR